MGFIKLDVARHVVHLILSPLIKCLVYINVAIYRGE